MQLFHSLLITCYTTIVVAWSTQLYTVKLATPCFWVWFAKLRRDTNYNSPTNRIVVDPIVVRTGTNSTQDTVIPFSAVLDRVDVNVVSLNAISVTV